MSTTNAKPHKPLMPATVRRVLATLQQEMREINAEFEGRRIAVGRRIEYVQARCPHDWKQVPDAAGGPTEYLCRNCEAWK